MKKKLMNESIYDVGLFLNILFKYYYSQLGIDTSIISGDSLDGSRKKNN